MTTQFAPLGDIIVSSNRQRRAFDESKHVELCDSIQNPAIGLLHPIVLRDEGGKKVLVAGERRLRAFRDSADLGVVCFHAGKEVPAGTVPYTNLGDMAPLDAWEAELEENIKRVDLSWQERADASRQLMELRAAQAKERGEEPPTFADIAEERTGERDGHAGTSTRREIIVSKHLDDPDIAGAKTLRDAYKVLKRKEERHRNATIAAGMEGTFGRKDHILINSPAENWITTCPSGFFDVVLSDPPYGMGADEFGDAGGKAQGEHSYEDSSGVLWAILKWMPAELFRVMKADSHAYIFCDIDWFGEWKKRLSAAGFNVFRTPLIWFKPTAYRAPWPEMGPQRKYETILYAVKGNRKTQLLTGDVLTYPPDENLGHEAQKPVALYRDLLSRSASPGDKALDLFCGTGPIFPAAHSLKVYATGVEKDPVPYAIAATRIKDFS